jgi:hypothetical protein
VALDRVARPALDLEHDGALPGAEGERVALTRLQTSAGDIRYRKPVTHTTENIGMTQPHAILVELMTP